MDIAERLRKQIEEHNKPTLEDEPIKDDSPIYDRIAHLPNSLARVSPFLLTKPTNQPTESAWENAWGSVSVKGIPLVIYDETVLLALLYLSRRNKSYNFFTSRYELCEVLGVKPQQNSYNAINESIRRLWETEVVVLQKDKDEIEFQGTLVTGMHRHKFKSDEIRIKVELNPYFKEMKAKGSTTHLDIDYRKSIKGDVAKALYRFYKSHQDYHKGKMRFDGVDTLCKVVNVKTEGREPYELRKTISKALDSLLNQKFLKSFTIKKNSPRAEHRYSVHAKMKKVHFNTPNLLDPYY